MNKKLGSGVTGNTAGFEPVQSGGSNPPFPAYKSQSKVCKKCNKRQKIAQFNITGKGKYRGKSRHSWCKQCIKQYDGARYKLYHTQFQARNKKVRQLKQDKLYEYLLQHPCVDCGEPDIVVLHFDHGKHDKIMEIGNMINRTSWENILSEIRKCKVRCANCHIRKTAKAFKWRKFKLTK